MKITHLGQAGLLIKTKDLTIMIDPYFTDSVGETDPKKHRRVEMDPRFWQLRPDVLLFTHSHLDHYDPATAGRILKENRGITVLAPTSVWGQVRGFGGDHNYVLFDRHTQWTEGSVRFTAVKAAHSDNFAIGVLVNTQGKTLYVTGDTLYNTEVLEDVAQYLAPPAPAGHPPHKCGGQVDVVFLPVNGMGNNMNATDAARFVRDCGAKLAVPVHVGLFDDLTGDILQIDNKVVLAAFETMEV